MNRLSVILLVCAISLFELAGCQREYDLQDDPETNRLIEINFTTGSLSGSLLKSAATVEEDDVERIILFGVDDQDNIVQTFGDIAITGQQLSILKIVKTIYAIANPSSDIEQATPATVSDLMALTCDFTNAPESPFLMSGKAEISGTSISIDFIRTVAKINITGKNNFVITSVTVNNAPKKGYVFERDPLSIPGNEKVSVPYTFTGSSALSIYVPENVKSDPIEIHITGNFQGNPTSYNYPVPQLKKDGNTVDVLRNNCYEVSIAPIAPNPYKNGIKILSIGNSYSVNSMQYMTDLLVHLGLNSSNIKLVCAYIGSGTLYQHAENARNNTGVSLQRITFGTGGSATWAGINIYTLQSIIQQESWDIITLQQASGYSFDPTTYNSDLDYLIQYVDNIMKDPNNNKKNPNYKLGWHMTWAWNQTQINQYDNTKTTRGMIELIWTTVQQKIVPNNAFDFIIPAGTAIQNARGFYSESDITYDTSSHLNSIGRYTAAAMWIKTITGFDIASLTTPYIITSTEMGVSTYTITSTDLTTKIVPAVNGAHSSPFTSP